MMARIARGRSTSEQRRMAPFELRAAMMSRCRVVSISVARRNSRVFNPNSCLGKCGLFPCDTVSHEFGQRIL
jgi:hypothetical protein